MNIGLVNSIRLIDTINSGLDYMEITIDGVAYKMFGKHAKTIKYVSGTVLYETAPDIYQGKMIERIIDIAEERVVTTTKATAASKLLPEEGDVNPVCNFEFASLPLGTKESGVICYLSNYIENCSDKARWYDLRVVDMRSRVYTLRYFSSFSAASNETRAVLDNLIGKYIKTDITYNQYGYQVQQQKEIELYPVEVVLKPEVEIACKIILDECREDEQLMDYIRTFRVVDKLKSIIDIEPGYHLVRIAMELSIIRAVSNITDTFTRRVLIRAAVVSRGYLIDRTNELSKPILNVNKVLRSALKTDMELINLLDALSGNTTQTKRMYISIAKFVKYIIEERRGLINEEDIINNYNSISDLFGGLL